MWYRWCPKWSAGHSTQHGSPREAEQRSPKVTEPVAKAGLPRTPGQGGGALSPHLPPSPVLSSPGEEGALLEWGGLAQRSGTHWADFCSPAAARARQPRPPFLFFAPNLSRPGELQAPTVAAAAATDDDDDATTSSPSMAAAHPAAAAALWEAAV